MLAPSIAVLAHQGGWDELGLVAAPLLVFGWLLWVANRRASRLGAPPEDAASVASTTPGDEDAADAGET